MPQHVHLHVIEPGCCTYPIDSLRFTDDPHMIERPEGRSAPGGSGIAEPVQRDGVWSVQRDIVLGQDVRDHPRAGGDR